MPHELSEPWRSFLNSLDSLIEQETSLHCCGGFVLTTLYGMPRPTADIDVLLNVGDVAQSALTRLAGPDSALHKKHSVYLDMVAVATYPDSYDKRLTDMHTFRRLQLLALDPYDLALSKLTRNADRDRSDVEYLGTEVPLDVTVLRDCYQREMRPYVNVPEREDRTLDLWIEMILERQAQLAGKPNHT